MYILYKAFQNYLLHEEYFKLLLLMLKYLEGTDIHKNKARHLTPIFIDRCHGC